MHCFKPSERSCIHYLIRDIPQKGYHCEGYFDKMWTIENSNYRWFCNQVAKTTCQSANHILTSEFKIDKEQNLGFACFNDTSILSTKVSELLIKEETSPDKGGFSLSILQETVEVIFSYLIFINKTLSCYFCKLGTKRDPFSLTFLNLFTPLGHLN